MPYRIELPSPPVSALAQLVDLGALDVEWVPGGLAALLPDNVPPQSVTDALGVTEVVVSPATPRDSGSVWLLSPREVRTGRIAIVPAAPGAPPDCLQLLDSPAFGSGHHPTTLLCLEALDELLADEPAASIFDVGTGSGILALAALRLGVPQAVGVDIDRDALTVATRNAEINGLSDRLRLEAGGPDAVDGQWPLVVANVLTGPLIEMAPLLVRRVASRGRLVLSGIRTSLADDVVQPYRNLGMRNTDSRTRAGWTALTLRASW